MSKTRAREKQPPRGRIGNRDSPVDQLAVQSNNLRPGRRRSGSNESRNSQHTEEARTRPPREKREAAKKNEVPVIPKKLPERTKRGTFKGVDKYYFAR